jgi:hypothetical protein
VGFRARGDSDAAVVTTKVSQSFREGHIEIGELLLGEFCRELCFRLSGGGRLSASAVERKMTCLVCGMSESLR